MQHPSGRGAASFRRAGFNADFTTIEQGVKRYVSGYLDRADRYSRDGAREPVAFHARKRGDFQTFPPPL
jgi:hypothetical protein